MSRSEEGSMAPEPGGDAAEEKLLKKGPNGWIDPDPNPSPGPMSQPIAELEQSMEVDDDTENSVYEPEILWRRNERGGRLAFPRPSDVASLSSTRSLYDSDLDYHIENDRRYVSNYYIPNDEDEQLRMQIMHQVFLFLLNSELTTVPLAHPTKILDIGTGTGDWVLGVGEAYPDAEVIGTDLAAIQPAAVPPNVFFEIFDAEDPDDWTYPDDVFDLIHFRIMEGSFQSWDAMYARVFRHLKPGGWVEVVDFDDQGRTLAAYFAHDSEICAWFVAWGEALSRAGKEHYLAFLQPEKLAAAGFVDVTVSSHDLPMGAWPTDPDVRSAAKLWLIACLAGFEAVSLRPLTRDMGWDPEEVRRVCGRIVTALRELALDKEKAQGLSISVKVLVARKPFPHEDTKGKEPLGVDEAQPEGKRVKIDEAEGLAAGPGKEGKEATSLVVETGAATATAQNGASKSQGEDVEMAL